MDKLRALQYFVAAAQQRSLSGAARRLDVSVPAVAKMVNALERHLGARLFDRTSQGLALTADGQRYLSTCQPLLEQLAAADEAVSNARARPGGVLSIGTPPQVAQHCLLPALAGFHQSYPEIQIDLHSINRLADADAGAFDAFVMLGWPQADGLVNRRLAQTRLCVCASPGYWAAHGTPQDPAQLEQHACLLLRNAEGTVLDLWEFERDGEKRSLAVGGWLVSNHRDVIVDAAVAGEGVARLADLTTRDQLRSGQLVPVLVDWDVHGAPPIHLLYRAADRRSSRLRLFIDFTTKLFRELEQERAQGLPTRPEDRPPWYRRHYEYASGALRGRR